MSDKAKQNNQTSSRKRPTWLLVVLITLLALGALVAAIFYTKVGVEAKENQKREQQPKTHQPIVHYLPIATQSYASLVTAFGVAKPRYTLDLTSELNGRVTFVSRKLAVGQRVRKGQRLIAIEKQDFEKVLANRESTLASAELNLLEEQRKRKQALLEWEESGLAGTPDSPLVFRKPQIRAAQAAVKEAKLALKQSKADISNTEIVAPYDSVVVISNIQPGSILKAGATIAKLNSTDRVEIALPLTEQQWAQLPSKQALTAAKWPVTLYANEGLSANTTKHAQQIQWQGYVTRIGQTVDEKTRQRSLIVAVDNPLDKKNPLYAGSFLKANIEGRIINNLWKIPVTTLSQTGDIWLLDENDCLIRQPINIMYSRDDAFYIPAPSKISHAKVVLSPLNSYVPGMCVEAKNSLEQDLLATETTHTHQEKKKNTNKTHAEAGE